MNSSSEAKFSPLIRSIEPHTFSAGNRIVIDAFSRSLLLKAPAGQRFA